MSRNYLTIANELCTALEDLSFECFGAFGTNAPCIDTYNKTFDVLDRCRAELKDTSMPIAESISDAMMDLVDRLGGEYSDVDQRAWDHLLVYAPNPEQDEVAWMIIDDSELKSRRISMVKLSEKILTEYKLKQVPLYTSPSQRFQLSYYDPSFSGHMQSMLDNSGYETSSYATDEDGDSHKIDFSGNNNSGTIYTSNGKISFIFGKEA